MYTNSPALHDRAGKRLRIALTVAVALRLVAASEARADDAPAAAPGDPSTSSAPSSSLPSPSSRSPRAWYGYQTLTIDGGAFFLATFGAFATMQVASDDGSTSAATSGVAVVGLATLSYVIGPPIVHWAHGRVAAGFESVALRLFAPLAGLGVGALVAQITNGSKDQTALPVGAAFGLLAASALDATLLGWEAVPDHPPPSARIQPRVVLNARVAFVGLGGAF